MKTTMITVAFFLMALPTFGQQESTTDTNCTNYDGQIDCKSTTKVKPPPPPTLVEQLNKDLAAARGRRAAARQAEQAQQAPQEAIKHMLAEEKKERENKGTVDFIYCRQNPKGSITDYEGKLRTCADVIEYTKAFCSVNTEVERCNLAKSKAEVEKAFAALIDEDNTNTHRNRDWEQRYFGEKFAKLTKWGCMSFPDMTLPQRDGTLHPCPNAPEPAPVHADAGRPQTK